MLKDEKLLKILADIGLDSKQSLVYLYTLRLGPTTILKIARNTGLKRTSIYSVVETLIQSGLMVIQYKGWKKFYAAQTPLKLKNMIHKKQQSLEASIESFLSIYNQAQDQISETSIKHYQGVEGVKSLYIDVLESIDDGQDYFIMGDQEGWLQLDEDYFYDFIHQRSKIQLNVKVLFTQSQTAAKFGEYFQEELGYQVKILPQTYKHTQNLIVTNNFVAFHQSQPQPQGLLIKMPSVAAIQKQLYESTWNSM